MNIEQKGISARHLPAKPAQDIQYYLFSIFTSLTHDLALNFGKVCNFLKLYHGNEYYHFLQLHRYMWWQIWPPGQKRRVWIQHNSSKAIQDTPSIGLGGLARNYTYYFGDSCCCLFRYVFIILVTQIKHNNFKIHDQLKNMGIYFISKVLVFIDPQKLKN